MRWSILPLLLLCVSGKKLISFLLAINYSSAVNGFVYSCNEVKQSILKKTTISASNACVALGDYSVLAGFVQDIFVQDGTGKNQWNLIEVHEAGGCVNSTVDSWRIVTNRTDGGEGIGCDEEFTLLFSSIQSTIVTARDNGRAHYSNTAGNITVVVSRGGILLEFTCNNTLQKLDFYTGLGNGEEEEMFYLGSAQCDDQLSLWALDTAITVSIPDDGYIRMINTGTGGYLSMGYYEFDMIVMGSGKSNNLIQHGDNDKFLWLDADDRVSFAIDGFYEMDQKVGNNIVLTAATDCERDPCTTKSVPLNSSSVHMTMVADLLSFDYYTKVGNADYWRDDDAFFFRIISSPLTTESPTTIPPVKGDTDYSCGCDLTNGIASFSSDLWLDVIFLVDVSKSMDSVNLNKASSLIQSITNSMNIQNDGTPSDSNSTSIKYSRVGIIAVSDSAQIIADLSSPFPNSINFNPSNSPEANIGNGIDTSIDMFSRASNRTSRQLIYIITASDSSSTSFKIKFTQASALQSSPGDSFKNSGGIIAVTDVSPSKVPSLVDLSSPGYYNLGFRNNINLDLQMICDANCFCPQYQTGFSDDSDERETPSRGCYISQPITATFSLAMDYCSSSGSLLSTVHDDQKEYFLIGVISQFGAKTPFWIGYENNGKDWEWIDNSNSTYTKWASGQPNIGSCAYEIQTTGFNSAWYSDNCSNEHNFICEKSPCSVSNFCN
ncbi:hypothetical protein PRIPAC_70706 [Pristionchus pacificus]|nr:hypothetical protein PRIPAC_70706 [Pristionchus pacificus]